MPSTCPPRSNRQSQPETARTSEEGGEEHEGRKGEKMRTCARLPAVLPSKSYIDRTPPQTASPAPPQASRHPSPHRLKLPVSRRTPARFYLCQFCFWRNNCNQCKANREYVKEFGEKKQKGRHASAKRGARTKLQLMEDDYGFVEGI